MKKRKTISQRLLALTLCLLCLLAALPIAALADDAAEPTTEPVTQVTEAPATPDPSDPANGTGDPDPSEPADPSDPVEDPSEPSDPVAPSEPTETIAPPAQTEGTSAPSDPTETTAPAETETTVDPVQALYERLMACETLDEINAILYPETEEEQADVDALIAQFTEEQNAALIEKVDSMGGYDHDTLENVTTTIAIGNTYTATKPSSANRNILVVDSSGNTVNSSWFVMTERTGDNKGYTIRLSNDVPDGTYTATVTWTTSNGGGRPDNSGPKTNTDTITFQVNSNQVNASVFFLKSPTGDPSDNKTATWGNEIVTATINKRGATYEELSGYGAKNCFDPATYILTMPEGMVKQADGSYLLPKEGEYKTAWTTIFNTYKSTWEEENGGKDLNENDIVGIYLKPYKLSQNNAVSNGYKYPDHVDCTVSVKIEGQYLARFWVTKPGASQPTLVDSKTYSESEKVARTTNAHTGEGGEYPRYLTTTDGKRYVFDGWYNEDNRKVADSEWDYAPNEAELSDGAVDFYAHYIPSNATITITKKVSGNMLSHNDEFRFTVEGNVADADKSFTLKHGESKTITVNIGDTITVTEEGGNYSATYKVGENGDATEGFSATIIVAGDETIAFTNTHNVTIDTGILLDTLPYILILAVVALGAVGMVRKRHSRDED